MLKAGGTILTPLLHMAKSCSLFYSWDMNIHYVVEPSLSLSESGMLFNSLK
jgi:hypothetical protein